MMSEQELRKILTESGLYLLENNLVQGTWGNTSIRVDDKYMLVTPSGLDYTSLTPEDMAMVNIETLEWTGKLKPTSEKGIHAGIYMSRPDVNVVIHTHPNYCSVLASSRTPLPAMDDNFKTLIGGEARVGKYGLPGTKKLCKGTVEAMEGRNACLMANHGVLCAGTSMENAFEVISAMEKYSKLFVEKTLLEKTNAKEFSDELLYDYFSKN